MFTSGPILFPVRFRQTLWSTYANAGLTESSTPTPTQQCLCKTAAGGRGQNIFMPFFLHPFFPPTLSFLSRVFFYLSFHLTVCAFCFLSSADVIYSILKVNCAPLVDLISHYGFPWEKCYCDCFRRLCIPVFLDCQWSMLFVPHQWWSLCTVLFVCALDFVCTNAKRTSCKYRNKFIIDV